MRCPHCPSKSVIKKGFYKRRSARRPVQKYRCKLCLKWFSASTGTVIYRQRKPYLNNRIAEQLTRGTSERSCARLLHINRKTVTRRIKPFGLHARRELEKMRRLAKDTEVQFDDMETFEHTKCKPLSIAMCVSAHDRKILSVHVSKMPAKGHLAEISRRKYGPREDRRKEGWERMFTEIQHLKISKISSDFNPHYPKYPKRFFQDAVYVRHYGRKGCVTGQGEMKEGGMDPLFAFNHTAAMVRDNIKRLSRRTWCTTKDPDRLQDFLSLYAWKHNQRLKKMGRSRKLNLGDARGAS